MTNENKGGSLLKQLLYIFLIGIFLYYGGRGWACLFTSSKTERDKIGWLSIWLFVGLALFVLIVVIADSTASSVIFGDEFSLFLFKLMFFQLLLTIPGCLIAAIATFTGRD